MASSRSSGLKTADAVITDCRSRVNAVVLLGNGTNAASVVLYDNASAASGTVLAKISLGANHVHNEKVVFTNPVLCENGIYADVTGTGAEYIVYYGG